MTNVVCASKVTALRHRADSLGADLSRGVERSLRFVCNRNRRELVTTVQATFNDYRKIDFD
jgi:hypothetical protein